MLSSTLAVAALAATCCAAPAYAANGSLLRSFTAANPEHCGTNVGIAFDGRDLIMTCLGSPILDFLRPLDGSLSKEVTVPGHRGFGAAAWDATRNRLWACDSGDVKVVLIDPSNGSSVDAFTGPGCHDGLAYDGTDDTLWMGPDAADTVYHYHTNGALIAKYTGLIKLLGRSGRSGISVGGSSLYMANDGGQSIYAVSKSVAASTLIAKFPSRLEDLECDSVTFRPRTAIWSQDAFDRKVNAWEIPAGSCNTGGLAAVPPPPVLGRAADVSPVRGKIFVNVPATASHAAWDWSAGIAGFAAASQGTGFVPLTQARQIPVGSQLDLRAGTVKLVTASGVGHRTYSGAFDGGIIKITQSRSGGARGLTELRLLDGAFPGAPRFASRCGPGRTLDLTAASARSLPSAVIQRVRGNAHGRFRTRGRVAAATVRGTDWGTADRCDGTLTIVRRGTVIVSDFHRHRNVTVSAGHTYLARGR